MKIKLLLWELLRHSIAFSLAIAVFIFIMNYLQEMNMLVSGFRAITVGILLLFTSLISVGLIYFFQKESLTDFNRPQMRFLIGSLLTMGVVILYWYIIVLANDLNFLPDHIYDDTQKNDWNDLNYWQAFFLIFIPSFMTYGLIHLFHNFILLQNMKTQTEIELSSLRSANAEASNQLLRQQVQPHFLFNALSILKSLIKNNPQTAEVYLLRLSDFLRTSFAQNKQDVATVREEIRLCLDYLEMQKMRFDDALEYTFDVPDQYLDARLPFFSLQTLAENAIKHNMLTDESPLHIRIYAKDGMISVENNLQKRSSVEDSTGYGLSNLSERYQLLSGNEIEIQTDDKIFSVAFKII